MISSLICWIFPKRIIDGFTTFGLPFVLMGLIMFLPGCGVALFPSRVVEKQGKPLPGVEASIFLRVGTGKIDGLIWILFGLAMSCRL
jgi:hypothetical protein